MNPVKTSSIISAFRALKVSNSSSLRSVRSCTAQAIRAVNRRDDSRAFSTTRAMGAGNWLEPNIDRSKKMAKGRPRVATGGSVKGTTVIWGDYGLRMTDHHRRISAKSLKMAEDTIRVRLRGEKYRLFKRKCCNIGVYVSGNEIRMGKGKGSFDHWASRISVNQVLFELKGRIHEQVVRDAFRLAGNKLPGQWAFAKKGEAPIVGITQLNDVTLEELKRPRRAVADPAMLKASSPTSETEETTTAVASRTRNGPIG